MANRAQKAISEAERYLWLNRPDSEAVRAYLQQERGLTDETIRHYHLGYNPAWRKVRVDDQTYYLPPGIVIPWQIDGQLWSVKVRCRVDSLAQALGIPEDTDRDGIVLAKYRQLGGGNQAGALFNGEAIQPDKPVVFTEGELDAMLGQQIAGDTAAFVTVGSASSSLATRWRERVATASTLLLALDNDEAGQKATQRLTQALSRPSHIAPWPAGKDLTDFVVQHQGNVRLWLATALQAPLRSNWTSLPDSWRTAVTRYLADPAAPLLEMLVAEGLLQVGTVLDRTHLVALATDQGLSESTVRAGLEALDGLFVENLGVLPIDNPLETTSIDQEPSGSKSRQFSKGGRGQTNRYRVLPLVAATAALLSRAACRIWERCHPPERGHPLGKPQIGFFTALGYSEQEAEQIVGELEAVLQPVYRRQGNAERFSERTARQEYDRLKRSLADPTSTPLPAGWRYRNVHEYRACLARAIKQASPERHLSLKEWSERLGISVRSVAAVLARAGIASMAQYQEADIHSLDEVRQVGRTLKGYPKRLILRASGQQEQECRYDAEHLVGALRLGQQCTVRYQLANRQTIATEEQAEPAPRKPSRPRVTPDKPLSLTVPLDKPTLPRYCGPGYQPAYVRAWLLEACDLAWGYALQANGRLVDRMTGELLTEQPTDQQLVELLRGRAVAVGGEIIIDALLGWVTQVGGLILGVERRDEGGETLTGDSGSESSFKNLFCLFRTSSLLSQSTLPLTRV